MNPVSRGIRNAFRNGVRTSSIVLILGLSIGLSLTMLVAEKAVDNKIKNVKSSIGNTIGISPAGFNPGSQANNALTTTELNGIKSIAHVTGVIETLNDRQSTTGAPAPSFGRFGADDSSNGTTTSLSSPVTLNTNGPGRFFAGGGSGGSDTTVNFSLPITFLGTTDPTNVSGSAITLTKGSTVSGSTDTNNVLVSSAMASKNSLSVGSTFTAYNALLTVAGIFSDSNQSAQNTVVLSLAALQRLSGQTGDVTNAVATVDSLDNLSAATTAIKDKLGSSADVTSTQEQADNTVKPLNNVRTVATFSLIGAVMAGAVIILLVMIMVVRERKREIGVVKAIGGSNLRIIGEFMIESLTLAVLGAVVGLTIGVVGGQPVTKMLVDNSTSSTQATPAQGPGGRMFSLQGGDSISTDRPIRAGGFGNRFRANSTVKSIGNVKTQIGWSILFDGFGAAIVIALLGSALSAGMIARVRPSTIMRAD
ncbi:MAG TPA: FtsX-like permease family protein [Candidatus Saccharimonadia bacterium]|nr:FtsX-like permease family protein [Candidatus Saccharimonadia bacterium]